MRNGVGSTGSSPPVKDTAAACPSGQPAIGRIVQSAAFGPIMIFSLHAMARHLLERALRNCIVGQHNKSRAAVILTQQGEAIDRNWTVTVMTCQTALQISQHTLLAISRKCPGECHVESEILEDVGISPALDLPDLPPRQIGRQAPAAVGAVQGGAEAVEMLYA